MLRRRQIVLATAVTLVAGGGSLRAQDAPAPQPRVPEVTAVGEGRRTVAADRASVIVSVETRGRTPSQAGTYNAEMNNAIRAAIAALGVPREDISTYGYIVYALRQEPPYMRDTGFVANNSLRVVLRRREQLGLLGRIIDTALTAGATHVAGVQHEARSTDEAERAALADAVADARARAETIARAAGGSLGDLLQVTTQSSPIIATEQEFSAGMMRAAARARAVAPTMITAGEIEVRQYVVARWRFVPGGR